MALPSEAQLEYALARLVEADDVLPWQKLLGAVRLWCADSYDEHFYARPAGPDPVNTSSAAFVAIRGRSRLRSRATWLPSRRDFGTRREAAPDLGLCCAGPARAGERTLGCLGVRRAPLTSRTGA